jgi:hypothetical protein
MDARDAGFGTMFKISVLGGCIVLGSAGAWAQSPVPAPPPAVQELIFHGDATSILGRVVTGPDGNTVGRIIDVLVDETGQPRAAVIDVGGFLGVGSRRIAVAWRGLTFAPDKTGPGRIRLDMTAEQIKVVPEYKPASAPVAVAVSPKSAPPP